MEVINSYKEIAQKVISGTDIYELFKDLASFFEEQGMYQEQAGMLEKIYHLDNDVSHLLHIADIFIEKIKNPDVAFSVYDYYLKKTNPDFRDKFLKVLVDKGYDEFNAKLKPEEPESKQAETFADYYTTIVYIMVYLLRHKKYEAILELSTYLDKINLWIDKFVKDNPKENLSALSDVKDSNLYLSDILSNVKHHNDINFLSIKLNKSNEAAYLNILDDYITYGKYNEALDFYNNVFAPEFKYTSLSSPVDVCWYISDRNVQANDYYNSVMCQKIAIELELTLKGEQNV